MILVKYFLACATIVLPFAQAASCPFYCPPNTHCISGECKCITGYNLVDGECVGICPSPKIFKSCPTACPATCEDPTPGPLCPTVCRPGVQCVCPPGYVERSKTDRTCVRLEDCKPKCPGIKVFRSCPTACPATCEDPTPGPICPAVCRPGVQCVCPPGYVEMSKSDRTCVKLENCKPKCPGIKIFNSCPTACPATCEDPTPGPICPAVCRPGVQCVCPLGYVEMSKTDRTCVRLENCKPKCPGIKIFRSCPTACPATCEDPTPGPLCPAVCRPGVQCVCPPGYVERSKTDRTCVMLENCKPKCPGIKIFKSCPTACPATCEDPTPGPICPAVCRPGVKCVCPPGYLERSRTDRSCVKPQDCKRSCPFHCPSNTKCVDGVCKCLAGFKRVNGKCVGICPYPKIYKSCSTSCPKTCDQPNPRPCNKRCRPDVTCVCPDGYVELSSTNSKCVRKELCPKKCPGLKIFNSCPTACPATCENPTPGPICPTVCRPGVQCVCPAGYLERSDGTCVRPQNCKFSCPQIPCKMYEVCVNRKCICAQGYSWDGKSCKDKCYATYCPPNTYCELGECKKIACKKGFIWHQGKCIDRCALMFCPANSICRYGKCICLSGYSKQGSRCIRPPTNPCLYVKCKPKEKCRKGKCICKTGYYRFKNTCKKICGKCGKHERCLNKKCVCKPLYVHHPKRGCIPRF